MALSEKLLSRCLQAIKKTSSNQWQALLVSAKMQERDWAQTILQCKVRVVRSPRTYDPRVNANTRCSANLAFLRTNGVIQIGFFIPYFGRTEGSKSPYNALNVLAEAIKNPRWSSLKYSDGGFSPRSLTTFTSGCCGQYKVTCSIFFSG